jgi:D-3-phosphoglycerate dehydrogenase
MYQVAISHRLHEDGMAILERDADVVILDKKTPEITGGDVAGKDGIIIRIGTMDRKAILEADKLKVIGRPGVGVDNVDVKTATEAGIPVVVTPNANTLSVAEHTIACILALAKDIRYSDNELRKGRFEVRSRYKAMEIQSKTLGLIGFGHIGKETARLGKALGMEVLVYDPLMSRQNIESSGYAFSPDLENLLTVSDIVSIHVPLIDTTRNLIGGKELKMMKKEALLVNCSRGGIVNEEALYDALSSSAIAGAALDVFTREPPEKDNKLLSLENLIVTPHMAAQTREAAARMARMAAEGVLAVIRGEKWPHVTNPAAYEHERWKGR